MSSLTVFDHVRGLSDESGEVERSKPSDKRFKTSKKGNLTHYVITAYNFKLK